MVAGLVEEVDSARAPWGTAVAEGVVRETAEVRMAEAGA